MLPDPLHPAVVHFPIVLAAFFPIVAGAIFWLVFRDRAKTALWRVVLLYAAVMLVSARVAVNTGESQEDVVEEVVDHDFIHDHEESAEALALTAAIAFLAVALGLLGGKAGLVARSLSVVVSVVMVVQALNVGKTGGELVYVHGAAAAYVGDSAAVEPHGPEDDDDDD